MSELRLHTVLTGRGPAAAILLSDEQVASFGAGKAFPVAVTIGGRTARLRVASMGSENMIGFSKAVRADLGVEIDQEIEAVIRVDSAERTVDVPAELAAALDADPAVRAAFDALSYTARKEHARSVTAGGCHFLLLAPSGSGANQRVRRHGAASRGEESDAVASGCDAVEHGGV